MKTHVVFILIATVALGYLGLSLMFFAQRIDFSGGVQQEDLLGPFFAFRQQEQTIAQPNRMDTISRLSEADATRQLEQAASSETIPSHVQAIAFGKPIPSWDEMKHLGELLKHEPQMRSERVLYVITPTHNKHQRRTQMVDLVRLKQTLMLASLQHNYLIYWILIEDADGCSYRVRQIAEDSNLFYAHIAVLQQSTDHATTPKTTKDDQEDTQGHRGLLQRNAGLELVLEIGKEGVIYFADDDNGYDVRLFTELMYTRYTSIFAVGHSGGSAYERCHVDPDTGKVDAILTSWVPRYRIPLKGKPGKFTRPKRTYGIDMAGFALSTTALQTKQARFTSKSTPGMLETDFLSQLVSDVSELEPLAANCTRILAWHAKTVEPPYFNNPEKDETTFHLLKSLVR